MLTILGPKNRFCDGVTRRNFLKIGALGLGGLALPQILQAESVRGTKLPNKAVIMIFLPGGPSHQDIFDLKMDAPSEVRGEFKPRSFRRLGRHGTLPRARGPHLRCGTMLQARAPD